jgi:predicted SAM-dependent methyltransferase
MRASGSLKVIIGAGATDFVGWVATEYPLVDTTDLNSLVCWFEKGSVQAFLAEHGWEHLVPELALAAAVNCYQLLVPGGHLRVAVPDGLHPDPKYIDHVKPGGTGCEDHQVLYTYRTLVEPLEAAGFEVRLLEWFDEEGQFHFRKWDPNDGFACRSPVTMNATPTTQPRIRRSSPMRSSRAVVALDRGECRGRTSMPMATYAWLPV